MIARHLIITGHVQGVGYRNYLAYKAQQFHITGWVRNRSNGNVEAVVQGTPENVAAIILRARRGPPQASVNGVTISEISGDFTDFSTRSTE